MANTFIELNDTPSSISINDRGKFLKVSTGSENLVFTSASLRDLSDVITPTSPSDGAILQFNDVLNQWQAVTCADIISGGNGVDVTGGVISINAGNGLVANTNGLFIESIANVEGSYGNTTFIPSFTVNERGQIVSITENAIDSASLVFDTNTIVGANAITVTHKDGNVEIGLSGTGITAGVYGNSLEIPRIHVDTYGRITAIDLLENLGSGDAGNLDLSNVELSFMGDDGIVQTLTILGDVLDIAGGTNIETEGSHNQVTINLSNSISLSGSISTDGDIIAAGAITFGTLTDGGSQTISGITNTVLDSDLLLPTSGAVFDYVSSMAGSSSLTYRTDQDVPTVISLGSQVIGVLGGTNVTTSDDGSGNIVIDLDDTVSLSDINASGTIQFGVLSDGVRTIDEFINDPTMATASNSSLSTSQSIKTYIDSQFTAGSLEFQGDAGVPGSIDLDSVIFDILGGNNITTTSSGSSLTIDLDNNIGLDSIVVSGGVTAGTLEGTTITDGTLSISGGSISGIVGDLSTSGDVNGNSANFTNSVEANTVTGTTVNAGDLDVSNNATINGNANITGVTITSGITTGNISASNEISATDIIISNNAEISGTTITNDLVSTGDISFNTLTDSDGTQIDDIVTDIPSNNDNNSIATVAAIISYVTGQVTIVGNQVDSANLTITTDSGDTPIINLALEQLNVRGGNNITTTGDALNNRVTIDLDPNPSVTSLAASGDISFGTLIDSGEGISISKFVDAADGVQNNNNDTSIPTTAATINYVNQQISNGSANLTVSDGTQTGNINLANEELVIQGTPNKIDVSYTPGTDTFSVDLPNDVIIDNNLTVSGDFTVQGTVTVINTTELEVSDSIIRVNSDGAIFDAGLEANINGDFKRIIWDTSENEWSFGTERVQAGNFETPGEVLFGSLNDGGLSIDRFETALTNTDSRVPTSGAVFDYVTSAVGNTSVSLEFTGDDNTTRSLDLGSQILDIAGGNGITTTSSASRLTIDLADTISVTDISAGTVNFGIFTDGGAISITSISDSITNDDTVLPTAGAVYDYVESIAGSSSPDGLLLQSTVPSGQITYDIGSMPNVAARTYYADKIVLNVTTAFSGDGFDHIIIQENNGTGGILIEEDDADLTTVGTYVIDLPGNDTLTRGQTVQIKFLRVDGSTPAVTLTGSMVASLHYNWV